jgi:hypothetical protein
VVVLVGARWIDPPDALVQVAEIVLKNGRISGVASGEEELSYFQESTSRCPSVSTCDMAN